MLAPQWKLWAQPPQAHAPPCPRHQRNQPVLDPAGPWTPLRPTRSSHGGSSGGSPSQLSSGGASAQLAQSAGKHRRLALAAAAAVVALAAVGTLLALLTPPAVTPPAAPKGPYLTPLGSIYRGPQNPGDIVSAMTAVCPLRQLGDARSGLGWCQ